LTDGQPARPVLLDTGVYGMIQMGDAAWADRLVGRELVLSFVTVAEVLWGKLKAGWSEKRLAEERAILQSMRTIAGSWEVAVEYAQLYRRFSGSIGSHDLWIAACALAVPIELATLDSDFDAIATEFGLELTPRDE
jgi:predicted nucleic acid-binding protein